MSTVSLIAAADLTGAIGRRGGIPWHISADFRYFRRMTTGHPVVMGWLTWLSLGKKPLPGRFNIVISRCPEEEIPGDGLRFSASLEEALALAGDFLQRDAEPCPSAPAALSGDASGEKEERFPEPDEIFVIGGGVTYRKALPLSRRVYLTRVFLETADADAFFPELDPAEWREVSRSDLFFDEKSGLNYEFLIYERESTCRI